MSTETIGGASPSAATSRPAFLRELEALRAQRQPPSLELEHTPGGTTEQSVHREVSIERETRITQMEHRFRETRGHATNEFAVSQLRERASHDFERSR